MKTTVFVAAIALLMTPQAVAACDQEELDALTAENAVLTEQLEEALSALEMSGEERDPDYDRDRSGEDCRTREC